MTKGKKKRYRQNSNTPVPDPLDANDSSDSAESKSRTTHGESTATPCNNLHWSSSRFSLYAFQSPVFFFIVLVQKYSCIHVNKAVNINTVRKRLQKTVLQCSESECNNNTLEVCKLYLLYLVIILALIENTKFDKYVYIHTYLLTFSF